MPVRRGEKGKQSPLSSGVCGYGFRQPDPTTETSKARVIAKAVERRRIEEGEPGITLLISPLEDCKRLVFLAQGRVKGGHEGWRKVVGLGLRC